MFKSLFAVAAFAAIAGTANPAGATTMLEWLDCLT